MRFLSNPQLLSLVAALFGKRTVELDSNGLPALTEDERAAIARVYGENFAEKFASTNFGAGDADAATALFEEAVNHRAQELTSDMAQTIAQLRQSVETLASTAEPAPARVPAAAAPAAPAALNMGYRHNRTVAAILRSDNPLDMARLEGEGNDASIDVSELNSEFGAVMPPRVRLDIFNRNIYLGIPDAPLFTREQSNTDYKAAASLITEVSQAFTPQWTPKGGVSFVPIVIPYRRHKINVSFKPADIIKSWLTFLYEQGRTQAEMPITRYIVEKLILPKVADDVTRIMLGKGKFQEPDSTPSEGDAGASAVASMDGVETILVDDLNSSNRKFNHFTATQNPFNLTGDYLLAYVSNFAKAIGKYFVKKPLIYCSEEFLQHYQAQDYAVNGKYTGDTIGTRVRFTGFELQPLKCMYGSPILFATPKENMVMLVDYAKAQNCINKIEEHHYDVDIMGEYSLSVGFKIGEAVYVAAPEGYTPSSAVIGNSPEDGDSDWEHGLVPAPLSFSPKTATVKIGADNNSYPTLSNSKSVTVKYSSSDTAVATVNQSTGVVTLVSAGSAKITAAFEGSDDYAASSASYDLTVQAADPVQDNGGEGA